MGIGATLAWPLSQLLGGTGSCPLEWGFLRQEGCGIPPEPPSSEGQSWSPEEWQVTKRVGDEAACCQISVTVR